MIKDKAIRVNQKVKYTGEDTGYLKQGKIYTCISVRWVAADGRMVPEGYPVLLLSDVEPSGRIHRVIGRNFDYLGHESHGLGNYQSTCCACFICEMMGNEIVDELIKGKDVYR